MSHRQVFNKFRFLQLYEHKIYLKSQRDLNRILLLMMLNFGSYDDGLQFKIYQYVNIQHKRMFERVKNQHVVNQIIENNQQQFWAGKKHIASVESLDDDQIVQAINDLNSEKGKKILKVLRKIIRGFSMKYPQHQQVDQILIEYQSERDCIELSSDSKFMDEEQQNEIIVEEKKQVEQQQQEVIEEEISDEKQQQPLQSHQQSECQKYDKQTITEEFNQNQQMLIQIIQQQVDHREAQQDMQLSINNLLEQTDNLKQQLQQIQKELINHKQIPVDDQQQNIQLDSEVIAKQQYCLAYQDMIQKWYISALQQQQAYLYSQLMQQNLFHPYSQYPIHAQNGEYCMKMQDQKELISNEQNFQEQQVYPPQTPNFIRYEKNDTIPKNTKDNIDTSRRHKEIQQFVPHNISLFDKESQLPLKEYNKIQERVPQTSSKMKKPYQSFSKWIKQNPQHIKRNSQSSDQIEQDKNRWNQNL